MKPVTEIVGECPTPDEFLRQLNAFHIAQQPIIVVLSEEGLRKTREHTGQLGYYRDMQITA